MSLKRILFVPESASMGHVGRLLSLASSLPAEGFDVTFACDPSHLALIPSEFAWRPATSLTPEELRRRLAVGEPVLSEGLLRFQVEEDIHLMRELQPHLVVGDFRPSLSISAARMGIPYINVNNAHWSPWSRETFEYPGPVNTWWGRILGQRLGKAMVDVALPLVLRLRAQSFNRVRQDYGLPPIAGGLRGIYTHGDYTAYPDPAELVPTPGAPVSHRHIGPVLWEPHRVLPVWWGDLPPNKPRVYLSLGGTGDWTTFRKILECLRQLPVVTLVATSGRGDVPAIPGQRYVADYLPGLETCRISDLVICNGGAGSVYQALTAGVPVLGIAANMDQALVMAPVERLGAGRRVLINRARGVDWNETIKGLLSSSSARGNARWIASCIAQRPFGETFRHWVREIVGVKEKPWVEVEVAP